jgi:alkanesulfonate monooxygenase SsuD/methylene tetrahydromethanopterin reductase-like flavin-dependent oxidoreductase (luciferase family)
MRTTLCLDPRRPWPDLLKLARQAEAAGWDAVRVGDAAGPGARECLTVLGAFAGAVPRIQLEAVVAERRGRHPAVVAKLAATVDQLSAGRLLLGMAPAAGAGANDRLVEAFAVLRCLATQPNTTLAGQFYRLQDAPLDPKPRRQPLPLMLVGGDSDLAARVADHWSIEGDVATQQAALLESCRQTGRDPATITVAAAYPATGVDVWVVHDHDLGAGEEQRAVALARIPTEATAAAGAASA